MSEEQIVQDARDAWKYRRRVVFATMAFCMAVIVFFGLLGRTSEIQSTIVEGALYLLGATVLGYLGIPVVDDHLRRRNALEPR